MKSAIEQINHFLICSRWAVPLYFYVAVPLFLRRSGFPLAWILAAAALSFLWYWLIRWSAYRAKQSRTRRYIGDAVVMILGLAVLYYVEIRVYLGTNTVNLMLYLFTYFTYALTLLSTRRIDTK